MRTSFDILVVEAFQALINFALGVHDLRMDVDLPPGF